MLGGGEFFVHGSVKWQTGECPITLLSRHVTFLVFSFSIRCIGCLLNHRFHIGHLSKSGRNLRCVALNLKILPVKKRQTNKINKISLIKKTEHYDESYMWKNLPILKITINTIILPLTRRQIVQIPKKNIFPNDLANS